MLSDMKVLQMQFNTLFSEPFAQYKDPLYTQLSKVFKCDKTIL
ncbi:hypothetical protein M2326_001496 [Flavobacterium sp. 7A]|nr:hypothetical protein [Flavobacterium sp. 7A]